MTKKMYVYKITPSQKVELYIKSIGEKLGFPNKIIYSAIFKKRKAYEENEYIFNGKNPKGIACAFLLNECRKHRFDIEKLLLENFGINPVTVNLRIKEINKVLSDLDGE